jgi:nicotinamidase/pyrazinamidase
VFFSAVDAREAGFEVAVALDACRGIDLDGSQGRALATMRETGITLRESMPA